MNETPTKHAPRKETITMQDLPLVVGTGLTRGIGLALARELAPQVQVLSLQRALEAPLPGTEVLAWDLSLAPEASRQGALGA